MPGQTLEEKMMMWVADAAPHRPQSCEGVLNCVIYFGKSRPPNNAVLAYNYKIYGAYYFYIYLNLNALRFIENMY